MSALDNLLDEVRLEAEQAVRTEYENTVIELRARVTELEAVRDTLNKDRELWRTQAMKDQDRLIRVEEALLKLADTL